MRLFAAAACLFATGCATALGVTVPGPVRWERRPAPGAAAPAEPQRERRLELSVAREACSLLLVAHLADHLTYPPGEYRRVDQPLQWAVAWSLFAEQSEHLIGLALLPLAIPILFWQLGWWIYGRGLTAEERAVRAPPWGSDLRDLTLWSLWPGHNSAALWHHRARLWPLDSATASAWRFRRHAEEAPVPGAAVALGPAAGGIAMGTTDAAGNAVLALVPPSDVTEPWRVGGERVETAAPLELTAHTGGSEQPLIGRCALAPEYLARAARVRALRRQQSEQGRSVALHRELAELYEASGGYLQARSEWRAAAEAGDAAVREEAGVAIGRLWEAERNAARRSGDLRRALFCDAAAPLEATLRARRTDLTPLDGGPEVVAHRLRQGDVAIRTATALACACVDRAPSADVTRALLQAAAEYRTPLAAWAALLALIRHPTPDAATILPSLFRDEALPELRRGAAAALVAGAAEEGLRQCVPAAHWPAVQWVLADATGAGLDPHVDAWHDWWVGELPARRWSAERRMFVPIPGAR